MPKKYDYKVFPQTWKGWVLIIGAMVLGLGLILGYYAWLFLAGPGFISPWGFTDKIEVTYVNETDGRVLVYKDERLSYTLEPGELRTDKDYKLEWWFDANIAVYDDAGRLLFADELDDDDLEDMGYRIVIDD